MICDKTGFEKTLSRVRTQLNHIQQIQLGRVQLKVDLAVKALQKE